MRPLPIRKLAAGAAVMIVLAGVAIAAVTATGRGVSPVRQVAHARRAAHPGGGANIAAAARYLGLSKAQLKSELGTGRTLAQIADGTPGSSEAGLIASIVAARRAKLAAASAKLPSRVAAQVGRPLAPPPRIRGPQLAARDYLGLSPAQLRSDRRSGKTLAQIADAIAGKSEVGLIQALVAAKRQQLAAAVTAGTLTQADEQTRLVKLAKRMRALVEHKHVARLAG
jgi:hypothetical protein